MLVTVALLVLASGTWFAVSEALIALGRIIDSAL